MIWEKTASVEYIMLIEVHMDILQAMQSHAMHHTPTTTPGLLVCGHTLQCITCTSSHNTTLHHRHHIPSDNIPSRATHPITQHYNTRTTSHHTAIHHRYHIPSHSIPSLAPHPITNTPWHHTQSQAVARMGSTCCRIPIQKHVNNWVYLILVKWGLP